MNRWLLSVSAIACLGLSAPALAQSQAQSPVPSPAPVAGWAADAPRLTDLVAFAGTESDFRVVIVRYLQDKAAIQRRYPVQFSPARQERLTAFNRAWTAELERVDFDALNPEGRIDYLLLRDRLTYEAEALRLSARRAEEMAPLLPFAPALIALQETRLDRQRAHGRQSAETLDTAARQVEGLTAALEDASRRPSASPVIARRAVGQIEHLRAMLREWNTFYDGYDPDVSWWARQPYARLDAALDAYAAALNRRVVGIRPGEEPPIIGDPVLEAGLRADLALEMIPYSIPELIQIGEREFAWIEAQMKAVARDMGYGDDWKAALEHTKNLAPPPGEVPWVLYDIADYSEGFVERDGSVTMPPLAREIWRLAMQTPERQLINPFFSGGETTRVSYPTDGMTHEQKMMSMRGNTPHFNFATVHHELIPGHHLQGFMNSRFNPHRVQMGWTPFWGEGWALYWEFILWDKQFPRNDADKVGMLFWRMHRAARIVFSLNYQMGNWTPEQAVDFLVDRVGHERANAEAEVRRTTIDAPFYQTAYMVGGLQFYALRRELVDSGRMTEREFHDAVLQGGPMPVEMVRARLTGQTLTRDYRPSWRFYQGPPAN